jgi:hypothetical protein
MKYNGRVQLYNTSRRQFPEVLTALLFNFPDYPFFLVPMTAGDLRKAESEQQPEP